MPRQTRDQRLEEEGRKGREWAQWLDPAMAQMPIDVKTLVERARREGATFDKTNVSRWLGGTKNAEAHHAVIVARVLGRSPAEALRAAGHDALAAAWVKRTGSAPEPTTGGAHAWQAWLLDTAGSREAVLALSARSKGAISPEDAQAWADGAEAATSVAAILVARLLRVPEAEALRAAGDETYARVFDTLATPTPVLNSER